MDGLSTPQQPLGQQLRVLGRDRVASRPADVQTHLQGLDRLRGCVGGEVVDCGQGQTHLVVRNYYPLQHSHGRHDLAETLAVLPATLALLGRDERLGGLDWSQALFFDVETTGLAGGTGTLVFLVGMGRYVNGGFEVVQYFLASPQYEGPYLASLRQALDPRPFLVSYNGRCFDAPLLETRFILQRQRLSMSAWPHVDLLYPARRLYKCRTRDCSLKTIETQVLRVKRSEEDVPGALIPAIYFDYLRGGPVEQLRSVFYHNRLDILSLATLSGEIAGTLERRNAADPRDYVGAGVILEGAGRLGEAREAYERALAGDAGVAYHSAMLRLGYLLKRQGAHTDARQVWLAMIEAHADPYAVAHVELAKHLEHRERDHQTAVSVVRQALSLPGVLVTPEGQALQRRLVRLEGKCARATECRDSANRHTCG